MLEVYFIRHGKTYGNSLGRYIGTTDEPLSEEGKNELFRLEYEDVERVVVSPMTRCIQTAKILFPNHDQIVCEDLKECNFGEFENKNYKELDGNLEYQKWIDSEGRLPFPKGEDSETFRSRCCNGFLEKIKEAENLGIKKIAFVVHGGTIMSILEKFAMPKEEFYHWQVKNGHGYFGQYKKGKTQEETYVYSLELIHPVSRNYH